MKRVKGLSAEAAAVRIYHFLQNGEATWGEVCRGTKLTRSQFRGGLGAFNRAMAEAELALIICDPSTHHYSLPSRWREERRYLNKRFRDLVTRLATLDVHAAVSESKWGESEDIRLFSKLAVRLHEDAKDVLAQL